MGKASSSEPFIGDPKPWREAKELAEFIANSGGHSAIMQRGPRQVRVTYLRPDDVYNRDLGTPGFVLRGPTWDERLINDHRPLATRWGPFKGWSEGDRSSAWQEVSHTFTDKLGCASLLCAQYNHRGGLKLPDNRKV